MKSYKLFLALAMCVVAMGFVSCDKDDPKLNEKEYLFAASCHISNVENDETGEIMAQQREYVIAALVKAGFTEKSDYPLCISGKDSAEVSKVLLEKMAQVEKAIAEAPFEINAKLSVRGAEKSIVNSEDHEVRIIRSWYEKTFGTPSNASVDSYGQLCGAYSSYYFVKWFRTKGWLGDDYGDYFTVIGSDLNADAGGDYIYLVAEHSGERRKKEYFKWENQFSYITDVVAVKGQNAPNPIYIKDKGRWYYRENQTCDLNAGAGGEYIWLYATREKFPHSDGKYYYLNTGSDDCRLLYSDEDFDANKYTTQSDILKGHKFIERIVPMYDEKGGLYQAHADFNKGAGGRFIKMILSYATQEGGY